MIARRSPARAWLLLARVSNLPTVWTNVLAGLVAAGASLDHLIVLSAAASLFYTGGMVLNDAFDAGFDAGARSDRPIPAGDVSRGHAFAAGGGLLAAGEAVLLSAPHPVPAIAWGALLTAAVVFYDYRHKGRWFGPGVMGLCRALVYLVAAAAVTGVVSPRVAAAAGVMWAYVILLTWVARRAGPQAGVVVPFLLAGISLVDAAIVAFSGEPWLAVAAVAAFALTLALQRVVPGT